MRLRYVVVLVAAALALGAAVVHKERPQEGGASIDAPLLAVADGWLTRLDPRSLVPLSGGRTRIRQPIEAWARTPNGARPPPVRGAPEGVSVRGSTRTSKRSASRVAALCRPESVGARLEG